MKKCYNIKTWEEQKYVLIDLSEKNILIPTYHLTERKLEKMQEWYGKINDMFDLINAECSIKSDNQLTAKIQKSTPTDPVLARLCELAGAKMYDDYVVFQDCENDYKVFEEYSKHLRNEENKFEEIKKLLNL